MKPTHLHDGALFFVLALIFWTANIHGQDASPSATAATNSKPSNKGSKPTDSAPDTVRDMYLIMNDGTEQEMAAFHSKQYVEHVSKMPAILQKTMSFEATSNQVTRGHTVTNVEIIKVTYPTWTTYGASVTVCLHYKDGSKQNYNADMTKEDGVWKSVWE